ncbi:MAG TPA: glutamate--tRNA ligase [Candidatus Angelobacter sp.]|jgi:glutamyl-tRNA synthetase|nr:glutamate--tRNA ligase [Candidatus Angelobacter sp.]
MPQNDKVRVRFAPSPTGQLHIGNVRTALFNWLFARQKGGTFILRIEDTDLERSEARYETQLMEDLKWLGIDWDEGPDVGGPYPPYRQSDKMDVYRSYAERLIKEQKAYYCFCSAEELERDRQQAMAEQRQPNYSGKCRNIDPAEAERRRAAGEPAAIRLRIPEHPIRFHDIVRGDVEFSNEVVSDPIIVRSSGMPVYNYVVVIDDADMKITHVIRGDDHISNTPKQVAVYEALGLPVPEFAHLSTILGPDRERLSKRHGATSVANFREMGILPEALMNYLALLGWAPSGSNKEIFTKEELIREFDLNRVTPSPAIFDFQKLYWINRQYIKRRLVSETTQPAIPPSYDSFLHYLMPLQHADVRRHFNQLIQRTSLYPRANLAVYSLPSFIDKGWLDTRSVANEHVFKWFLDLVALFAPYSDRLDEVARQAAPVFHYDAGFAAHNSANAEVLNSPQTLNVMRTFRNSWLHQPVHEWNRLSSIFDQVKMQTGATGKALFHPIRIMLIGSHSGPDFNKLIPLIEEGSRLQLPVHVKSIRERINEFAAAQGLKP